MWTGENERKIPWIKIFLRQSLYTGNQNISKGLLQGTRNVGCQIIAYSFIVGWVEGSPCYLCFLFGCLGNVGFEVHFDVGVSSVGAFPRNLGWKIQSNCIYKISSNSPDLWHAGSSLTMTPSFCRTLSELWPFPPLLHPRSHSLREVKGGTGNGGMGTRLLTFFHSCLLLFISYEAMEERVDNVRLQGKY